MKTSLDAEVQILAGISAMLETDYAEDDDLPWRGSPFAWIRSRPSRQKGTIGEKLVAGWLAARGFNVSRATNSDADRVIEGKSVEIKLSMLWKTGSYKFQQLRDQDYDVVVCLGISPFDAHCWVIEKQDILRYWKESGDITSQHASGSDTAWITVDPKSVPGWLRRHGGGLREGLAEMSRVTGFSPKDAKPKSK
jgi:hypothetical protein